MFYYQNNCREHKHIAETHKSYVFFIFVFYILILVSVSFNNSWELIASCMPSLQIMLGKTN